MILNADLDRNVPAGANPNGRLLETWALFLDAHHLLALRLDRELEEAHGFGLTWYDILYQLHTARGRLRMHELADATLFSRTDCTRLVDRMEAVGYVRRERATDDRRGVYAVLAEPGEDALREAAPTHLAGIRRHFGSHLSATDVEVLHSVFHRVLAGLEDQQGEGPNG
jgi:DNA-binding MarR family transcriptional regulator